jgi:hypothetical protein
MNLTVQDSVFTNAIGSLASISANQNSLMDVVSRRNKFSNDNPNQASGGGGLVLQSGTGASTVTYGHLLQYLPRCHRYWAARVQGARRGNLHRFHY